MLDFEYKKTAVSLGGLFEFETPACECFPEKSLRVDLTFEYPLKIKTNTKAKMLPHRYCFTTNEGLVDVNVNKSKKQTEKDIKAFASSRESDIITSIPATSTLKNKIKYFVNQNAFRLNPTSLLTKAEFEENQNKLLNTAFSEEDQTVALSEYIRKFGYLFNPPKNPRKINVENLSAFYDRLYALIILITELNKNQLEMDYNVLFYCTTFLANAKQVSLTSYSKDNDVEKLSSCHEFRKAWENVEHISVKYITDGYDGEHMDEEFSAIKEGRLIELDVENPYLHPDSKYAKHINFSQSLPEDATPRDNGKCTHVYDSILKKKTRLSFYTTEDYFNDNVYWPLKEDITFRNKICDLYASYEGDADTRELIEFLMHIYAKYPSMTEEENGAFSFKHGLDLNRTYAFGKDDMKLLPAIAKKVIKKEMDYYLSNIHPVYDAETMTASWEIPDLLTAMYFSLFYYNPKHTIYKVCERTDCGNLIVVTSSDTKKKYCSAKCNGVVTQRRFRKKMKEEKLNRFGIEVITTQNVNQ